MRLLWLTYERPPHPDSVCYPASETDAEFVVALLGRSYPERIHLTGQLVRYLEMQRRRNAWDRFPVACRTPSGIYHCVPWRLAKWLRHTLPAAESVLQETSSQISRWLQHGSISPSISSPNL